VIEKILRSSFARPGLALTLVLAGTALGAVWLKDLRRDVFPDLAAPVFNVIVHRGEGTRKEAFPSVFRRANR
jgi:heavy metal efflux system protein